MADVCKVCKAELINGEGHTLSAASKNFEVTVEDMPVRRCPKGHEGLYWFDGLFGTAFTNSLVEGGLMARGRRGLTLRLMHYCPACGERLGKEKAPHEFRFDFATKNSAGRRYRVTLKAPALYCARCDTHLMPYDKGHLDAYYMELHDLVLDALRAEYK